MTNPVSVPAEAVLDAMGETLAAVIVQQAKQLAIAKVQAAQQQGQTQAPADD